MPAKGDRAPGTGDLAAAAAAVLPAGLSAGLTRRRSFDKLVKATLAMGGFHFPFPALGTLEASGTGYQFKPMA